MASRSMDIRVADNGRMVLPASVRKAMGLHGDTKAILTIEDDQVRLSPIGHGVSHAQALYREHAKHARTTDDFLGDRKIEDAADLNEPLASTEDRDAAWTSVVLDASSVLALVRDEPGADKVAVHVRRAAISAVNLQEVIKELLLSRLDEDTVRELLDELRLDVRSHDVGAAYASAALHSQTREYGRASAIAPAWGWPCNSGFRR